MPRSTKTSGAFSETEGVRRLPHPPGALPRTTSPGPRCATACTSSAGAPEGEQREHLLDAMVRLAPEPSRPALRTRLDGLLDRTRRRARGRPQRPGGALRPGRSQRVALPRDVERPAHRAQLLLRRSPGHPIPSGVGDRAPPGGRPHRALLPGARTPPPHRRPRHLGHRGDAHPRRRRRAGPGAARRAPPLAPGDRARHRGGGGAPGGAGAPPGRRHGAPQRLLQGRLPAPGRPPRPGRAAGRRPGWGAGGGQSTSAAHVAAGSPPPRGPRHRPPLRQQARVLRGRAAAPDRLPALGDGGRPGPGLRDLGGLRLRRGRRTGRRPGTPSGPASAPSRWRSRTRTTGSTTSSTATTTSSTTGA